MGLQGIQQTISDDIRNHIKTSKPSFFTKMNIKAFSLLARNHPDQLIIVLSHLIESGEIIEVPGGKSESLLGRVPGYMPGLIQRENIKSDGIKKS